MGGLNPFMPLKRADLVIVDGRVSKEIINSLEKLNIDVVLTKKCDKLYEAISYHPDILMHPINSNTLIIEPEEYDYYNDLLKNRPIKILKGEKKLKSNYPDNIAYNVARLSNYAIHNFKYTDEKLMYYLKKQGLQFINVNQGYSKCSVAIIDNNALITSDNSIAKKCDEHKIDVLKINEGFILLPGLNYGFIGGSLSAISESELTFSGIYSHHPDFFKIKTFLKKYEKKEFILSRDKIIDIGSIIPLSYN